MRDKMRKKYQNYFNKKVKAVNDNIYNDSLWKGRFVFHQIAADWERFDDNSGGLIHALIRAYDKETDYYRDFWVEAAPWLSHFLDWDLNMKMTNTFIMEDVNVWDEEVNPYDNNKDWRKIKVSNEVWQRPLDQWIRSV